MQRFKFLYWHLLVGAAQEQDAIHAEESESRWSGTGPRGEEGGCQTAGLPEARVDVPAGRKEETGNSGPPAVSQRAEPPDAPGLFALMKMLPFQQMTSWNLDLETLTCTTQHAKEDGETDC